MRALFRITLTFLIALPLLLALVVFWVLQGGATTKGESPEYSSHGKAVL